VWDMFLRKPAVELLKITGCEYKWETTDLKKTRSLYIQCEVRVTKTLNPDRYYAFIRLNKVYDGNRVIPWGGGETDLNTTRTKPQSITLIARGINLTSDIIGVDLGWYIWKCHYFSEDELLATGEFHKTNISVTWEVPTGTVSFNITFRRVIMEEPWNTGDIYLFLNDKEIENYTVPTFHYGYTDAVDSPDALTLKNTGPSSLYAALVPYEVPKGVEVKMYVIHADRWEGELLGERQYARVMYSGGTVTFYLRMRITEPLEFEAYNIKLDLVIAYFESTIQKAVED